MAVVKRVPLLPLPRFPFPTVYTTYFLGICERTGRDVVNAEGRGFRRDIVTTITSAFITKMTVATTVVTPLFVVNEPFSSLSESQAFLLFPISQKNLALFIVHIFVYAPQCWTLLHLVAHRPTPIAIYMLIPESRSGTRAIGTISVDMTLQTAIKACFTHGTPSRRVFITGSTCKAYDNRALRRLMVPFCPTMFAD